MVSVPPACFLLLLGERNFRVTSEGDGGEAGARTDGPHLSAAACLQSVLAVLLVCRMVWGQRWSVDPRMVESTVVLVPAAPLHHEVTAQRPFGHVCRERTRNQSDRAVSQAFSSQSSLTSQSSLHQDRTHRCPSNVHCHHHTYKTTVPVC